MRNTNQERISLADTKRTKSYQTEETTIKSKHISSNDIVVDDGKSSVSLKQLIYLFLVSAILISSIAVTVFLFKDKNGNNNHHNHEATNKNYDDYDLNVYASDSDAYSNDNILESSSKKDDWFTETGVCDGKNYLKESLKLQYSANFGGIVMDLQNTYKYEASGVRYDGTRDKFFVVFDSLYGLGSIDPTLQRSYDNKFVPNANNEVLGESGFEGIAIDPENSDVYVVTEAVDYVTVYKKSSESSSDSDSDSEEKEEMSLYRAVISHVSFEDEANEDGNYFYSLSSECMVEYNFTSENKGLEGLSLLQHSETGTKYFLGLCEGNYCKGSDDGKDSGHGRMLVISFDYETIVSENNDESDDYGCIHRVSKVIELPKSVYFTDYSAMSFRQISKHKYKTIIVSQEDSAMWLGEFNLDTFEFSESGDIFVFPRQLDCVTTLCNVEGIDWIDNNTVVAVTDKTKSKGKQEFQCSLGDQSIFIFTIPP